MQAVFLHPPRGYQEQIRTNFGTIGTKKKYKKRTLKTNSHWKCSKYVVRHLGRPPPSPQIYASQSRKWRWRQTNIFSKWFQAFHPPTCIHLRVSMADCNCFSYGCVSDRKRTVCVCVCVCDIYMYIYRYRYVCVFTVMHNAYTMKYIETDKYQSRDSRFWDTSIPVCQSYSFYM